MKKRKSFWGNCVTALLAYLSCVACGKDGPDWDRLGCLRLGLDGRSVEHLSPGPWAGTGTASADPNPVVDTNEFILTLASVDAPEEPVYQGRYVDRPKEWFLEPGTYAAEVISRVFEEPAFAEPQYGDRQLVVVTAGRTVGVTFWAHALNAGLRFRFTEPFPTVYAGWYVSLTADSGQLAYGLREQRIAYFLPGRVEMQLTDGVEQKSLGSRFLSEGQVLTLTLSTTEMVEDVQQDFSIVLDTSRIWINEELNMGDLHDGRTRESALTVGELVDHVGAQDVWVVGYVVGGDLTSSSIRFDPPFEKTTNLALAASVSERNRDQCASVELKTGAVRDALNLVEHPEMYGRRIWICGDIVASYYGLVGVKSISEWNYE